LWNNPYWYSELRKSSKFYFEILRCYWKLLQCVWTSVVWLCVYHGYNQPYIGRDGRWNSGKGFSQKIKRNSGNEIATGLHPTASRMLLQQASVLRRYMLINERMGASLMRRFSNDFISVGLINDLFLFIFEKKILLPLHSQRYIISILWMLVINMRCYISFVNVELINCLTWLIIIFSLKNIKFLSFPFFGLEEGDVIDFFGLEEAIPIFKIMLMLEFMINFRVYTVTLIF